MDNHQEERDELAEDDEKLQLALQEVTNEDEEWDDYYDDDVDEDENGTLLIDLEAPSPSPSSTTGQSSSGYVASGSRGHYITIDEDSQERRGIPAINVPSQEKTESFTAEKTLALNQALQGILESRIESIEWALENNREKQSRLNDGAWADIESKKPGRGRTWGPFRTPFFKSNEADSFPPDNEDTIMKRKTNELHYDSMKEPMSYSAANKETLLQAIVEDTREMLMRPFMKKLEVEIKKATELRRSADEKGDDVQVLHNRWKILRQTQSEMMERKNIDLDDLEEDDQEMREVKKDMASEEDEYNKRLELKKAQDLKVTEMEDEIRQIKHFTDNEVLTRVDSSKVDWMKLSKLCFKDNTSWLDCQKAWDFIGNPRINLKPWNKEEEARLLELVEKHEAREWEAVAQELGTCRTPFHCFCQYQSRLNPEFKSRVWSKEEDEKLNEAVKRVREMSNTFSWGKVSSLINSRSTVECRQRYSRIGKDRNFGRWSSEEDARLIMSVDSLGMNWCKVAKLMGNRTVLQCRQRYKRCLDPDLNFFHFTYEDDKKLLRLHKKLGRQWVKIAGHFKGRTDAMVKSRCRVLDKWRKETDWWESLDDTSKNLLLGKNLTIPERKQFEGHWKSFYNLKLGVADKDYIRREKDKEKGVDPDLIPPRPPIHLKYSKFQRGFAERKHATWSRRLTEHHQLLENLKKRFEEEQAHEKTHALSSSSSSSSSTGRNIDAIKNVFKNNCLKDGDLTDEERRMKALMDSTLANTDSSIKGKKIPIDKMNTMLSALNLHFLGDSNIQVSEILKSTQGEKYASLRAHANHRKTINLRIRRILAKNKWIFLKGRRPSHRPTPPDNRKPEDISKEAEDWDRCVPSLLMKRLGGDALTLMKSIKEKIAKTERERKNLPHFENDTRYKAKIANQKRKIKEVKGLWHLPTAQRKKLESACNKKMQGLRREFRKAYTLKRELFKGVLEAGEKDSQYIENLENCFSFSKEQYIPSSLASTFPTVKSSSSSRLSESLFESSVKNMLGGMEEVESVAGESGVTYSSINFLPPCLATLTALRVLLLHRQKLMATAGGLYYSSHYLRKKKQQLHIVLDSDEEEKENTEDGREGEMGDGREKERNTEKGPSIKAIEVVDGVNDDEVNSTDLWFQPDGETSSQDKICVDKELEIRGNLPSTCFAPYSSKIPASMSNHRYLERINLTADASKYEEKSKNNPETLPKVRLEPESSTSKYEIMYAPTARNFERMMAANPDIKFTKPVFKEKNSGQEEDSGNDVEFVKETIDLTKNSHSEPIVKKPVEITGNPNREKINTASDKNGQTEQDGDDEMRIRQTFEGLKKSAKDDNLNNVVMVGLNPNKNEIVHYTVKEANESVRKSHSCFGTGDSKSTGTNDNISIVDSSSVNTKDVNQQGTSSTPKSGPGKVLLTLAPLPTHSTRKKADPDKVEVKKVLANMPHIVSHMMEKTKKISEVKNVVVVGVDPNSGKVVHYKKGDKAEPSIQAMPPSPRPLVPPKPKTLEEMTESELKGLMAKVRGTDEYQRLLTRFRSLFMWPVLMSTTMPGSEINLSNVHLPRKNPVKKEGKRPPIRRRKLVKREEKPPTTGLKRFKRARLDYSKILPRSERPRRELKQKPDTCAEKAIHLEKLHFDRIKRTAMLPDWWKDAITEVMLKKNEIERGQHDNFEVDISRDEDFMDKGNYSDDEWLAELREEEKRGAEEKKSRKKRKLNMERLEEEEQKRKRTNEVEEDELRTKEDLHGSVVEPVDEGNLNNREPEKGEDTGDGDACDDDDDDDNNQEMREDGTDDAKQISRVTFYITGEDGKEEEVRLEVTD